MTIDEIKKELIEVSERYIELYDLMLKKEKEGESMSDGDKKMLSIMRVFEADYKGRVANSKSLFEFDL